MKLLPLLLAACVAALALPAAETSAKPDKEKPSASATPKPDKAKAARHKEALDLLRAREKGDESKAKQCDALVESIRRDTSYTPGERYQVAVQHDRQKQLRKKRPASRKEAVESEIELQRALAKEFPKLPFSYQRLIELAEQHPDPKQGRALAASLITPATPAPMVVRAQTLIERLDLVGQSLDSLLPAETLALLPAAKPGKNRRIVLYGWSADHPASLTQAQKLATDIGGDCVLLGINLDTDTALARETATELKLPELQVYDPLGPRGLTAQRLMFNAPGLICATDAKGTITTITAHLDLPGLTKTFKQR